MTSLCVQVQSKCQCKCDISACTTHILHGVCHKNKCSVSGYLINIYAAFCYNRPPIATKPHVHKASLIYIYNTIKVLRNWHKKLLSSHTGLALSSESVEVLQLHVISQWHKLWNMKPCQLDSMTSNGKDPRQLKQQLPFPVSRFPPLHQAVGFKQHLEQSWLIK